MKQRIRDKLENLADRLQELDRLLATSEAADMDNYRKLTREHAEITPVVEACTGGLPGSGGRSHGEGTSATRR